MKNRNTLIMSGLLALTLGLGVSGTAFAAQDFSKKSPGYSQAFDSQMIKIMNENDYLGWRQLVQNKTGNIDPLITQANFPKFVEAWKLAREGNIKEANIIRKELGLRVRDENRNGNGMRQGHRMMNNNGMGGGHFMNNR